MIDIILIIIFALGFFIGWRQGFIKSVSFPLGVLLGVFLGKRIYPFLASYLGKGQLAKVLIFILVIIFITFLVVTLAKILSKLLHSIFLGWLDSFLGGLAGIVFSFFLSGFFLYLLLFAFPKMKPIIEGSGLTRRVLTFWLLLPLPKPKGIEEQKPPAKPRVARIYQWNRLSLVQKEILLKKNARFSGADW